MNLSELNKKFNTKKRCIKHLEKIRWGKNPICPHCESEYYYKRKATIFWHCNTCNQDSTVLYGTVFENTRLSLPKWFQIIFIMLNSKMGISAMELARVCGISYKAAWYGAMRIRCAMLDWGQLLDGVIEMDETYIGGKPRYRKRYVPNNVANLSTVYNRTDVAVKRGRGTAKVAVAGAVQRQGNVVAKVMQGLTSRDLLALLKKAVKTGTSKLITDEFRAYRALKKVIKHSSINHANKEYVRGEAHTNTIEGFWSIIKNGIRGNFRVVSKKYLPFYLAEYCYRYNRRKLKSGESFDEMMGNTVDDSKCFVDYKPKADVKKIIEYGSQKTQREQKEAAANG
jgi:transposase-like protein